MRAIKNGLGQDELYEHYNIKVDAGQQSVRIDKYLAQKLPRISRTRIKNASLAGCIHVNDEIVRANYKIKPNESVSVLLPFPPAPEAKPENIPIEIIYEDDDVIIVNKKAGMVVHPGHNNYTGTLVSALLYHFKNLPAKRGAEFRPGLVHRLDKNTSGLLVVAKNEYAMSFLAKQFFEHTVKRDYLALVWGDVKNNSGTIRTQMGRSIRDRKIFQVFQDNNRGKNAVTHYEVLERFGYATLIKLKLETGRTHQIRVHMKHIGHPVFNDATYGGDKILFGKTNTNYKQFIHECFEICPRQALHARTLGFLHPKSESGMIFEQNPPDDFSFLIDKWREFHKFESKG